MERTTVHQTENSVHTLIQMIPQDDVSGGGEVSGAELNYLLFHHRG